MHRQATNDALIHPNRLLNQELVLSDLRFDLLEHATFVEHQVVGCTFVCHGNGQAMWIDVGKSNVNAGHGHGAVIVDTDWNVCHPSVGAVVVHTRV